MGNQEVCCPHGFLSLLHSSLAHTGFLCFLVNMAEHGCQLLLNFTCYNLDRQGEIDVGLPVPSSRTPLEGTYRSSQGQLSTLGLWPEVWSCCRNMAITIKSVDGGRKGKSLETDEGQQPSVWPLLRWCGQEKRRAHALTAWCVVGYCSSSSRIMNTDSCFSHDFHCPVLLEICSYST